MSMGYSDHIEQIQNILTNIHQTVYFTEVYSKDEQNWIETHKENPFYRPSLKTLVGIKNFFLHCEKEEWKFDTICDLFDTINITQCIIYCNSNKIARFLVDNLQKKNYTCSLVVISKKFLIFCLFLI